MTGEPAISRDLPKSMKSSFGVPLHTPPMEAKAADTLPADAGLWQYEPKWDGFRCLTFKSGEAGGFAGKVRQAVRAVFPGDRHDLA
jgi:ATP-dependent DNA ligase